jgi:hypothetical protein
VRLLVLLVGLLAAACTALEPASNRPAAVDAVIGEALSAARAPAAEQKAALGRAQQSFLQAQAPLDRLRLGALLVLLPAPLRDEARAAELLEPIADASSAGAGRFAALLLAQIAERQRLARELERSLRERERTDRERERADKERDKREEALRQQLEALRSIERGILEREDRLRRKPR